MRARVSLLLAVLLSGCGGLTWEVVWQHTASLALGVSAQGTAITLAAVMLGIGIGGLVAARASERGYLQRPMRAYALAELTIGVGGLLVAPLVWALGLVDGAIYSTSPMAATVLHVAGLGAILVVPSAAMGATIPLLAPHAKRTGTSLSVVYATNVGGAVGGVLLATFVVLPRYGVTATTWLAAAANVGVAAWAFAQRHVTATERAAGRSPWPPRRSLWLAFGSAFIIFVLEVSWFRSFRVAFQATTETFAVVVAAFLLALSLGGGLATWVRQRWPKALGLVMIAGAAGTLVVTPHIDQIDLVLVRASDLMTAPHQRFIMVLKWVLLPIVFVGTWFPWLLAEHSTTEGAGRLYAVNTLGAVSGSLCAGFMLLPSIGASATSWVAAGCAFALASALERRWWPRAFTLAAALGSAVYVVSVHDGGAQARVQGFNANGYGKAAYTSQGPDSTVWVAEVRRTGNLALIIDGFQASSEEQGTDYMAWMGHLPALAAPNPHRGLVICFGTGQTANALYQHTPRLTIVDINPAVFEAAPLFTSNDSVLARPGVEHVVMDGRAYLRRHSDTRFDVVTLEPLPPNFAGANNLYSVEFYELVRSRLRAGGTAAQWLPFHLVSEAHMRSIVAAFTETFPFARLWIADHGTGILVGSDQPWQLHAGPAPLALIEIEQRFALGRAELERLSRGIEPVTDDNQVLAYGLDRFVRGQDRRTRAVDRLRKGNLEVVFALQRLRASGTVHR